MSPHSNSAALARRGAGARAQGRIRPPHGQFRPPSLPTVYDTPLSTADVAAFAGTARLGAPLPDAPLTRRDGTPVHLLECLRGSFQAIYVNGTGTNGGRPPPIDGIAMTVIGEDVFDREGVCAQRLDAAPGSTYLVRPDQHLCARWRTFDAAALADARRRALVQ